MVSPGKLTLAVIEEAEQLPPEMRETIAFVLTKPPALAEATKKGLEIAVQSLASDTPGNVALAVIAKAETLPPEMRETVAFVLTKPTALAETTKKGLERAEKCWTDTVRKKDFNRTF